MIAHRQRMDEFPHMDEARTISDRDLIAVTAVRSDFNVRTEMGHPIIDAYVLPDGGLALLDDDGDTVGTIAPRLVNMLAEQA